MLKREFKLNFKSLCIWTLVLAVLFVLIFSIYPSIMSSENSASINDLLTTMPESILKMFNMDISEINTAMGWFQTEGNTFLVLIGSIFAAMLGSNILLKEESDKTIEFLATKPVSRNKIIKAKILCGIINIFLFYTFIAITNFITLSIIEKVNISKFLLLSYAPILISYSLFFMCLAVSTLFNKTKKTMPLAMGIVFVSYFLQTIGNMSEKISFIKCLSVFELANIRDIILHNKINFLQIAVTFTIVVVTIFLTVKIYNKKELV